MDDTEYGKTYCSLESGELCVHELLFMSSFNTVKYSLADKLHDLFVNKSMSDVKIVVGEEKFDCHRLILSLSSSVFQTMLTNAKWAESKESNIILIEHKECAAVFKYFLYFIYTGKINFTMYNVLPLLMLADKYDVQDLVQSCSKFMVKNLPLAIKAGVLASWIKYSEVSNSRLAKIFTEFARLNFSLIIKTKKIDNFDFSLIISLIRESDLIVEDEKSLFRYIQNWINIYRRKHPAKKGFRKLMREILLHIRFPLMSINEINDILLNPLANEDKEFFFDRMAIGLAFHRGDKRILQRALKENCEMLFKPRLYISNGYSFTRKYSFEEMKFEVVSDTFNTGVVEGERKPVYVWKLELYPRGVTHEKCILNRGSQPRLLVPGGNISNTTRIILSCLNAPIVPESVRIRIVILIYENICSGTYVTKMHDITHNFSSDDKLIIIDRFLEICEITKPGLCHPNINLKDTLFTLRIIALPINELEVFKRENFTSTAS